MVSNFEFLEKDFPVLANFGELAEKYCYSDSNSCLMKLGMIGETIVNLMFTYDRIALPQDNTAVARIDTLVREGLLTRDLATILHGLRKVRNKAVHENYSSVTDSKNFLLMAYGMCEWFMQTYGDWSYTHKDFVMPEENVMIVSVDKEAEEKKEAELAKVEPQTIETCEKFIYDVMNAMGMEDVKVTSAVDEEGALSINMEGSNMGILIGKRGQTLDSLQYLTNRVANKMQDGYVRVKLDTEDYRRRRKETLENLAKNIASKVKRTRKTVSLEPMNPYERRIIHSALQSDPAVSTHSEGEEPYRRVVVTLVRNRNNR